MSRHHRNNHSHSHERGSSKIVRQVYIKIILFYFLWAVMGLFVCLMFDNKPTLTDAKFSEMNFIQQLFICVFKYFLNFPLGISNWFTNRYILTTYLFFVPDSLFIAWVFFKINPHHKKADKILNFILVIMFLLMLVYTILALIFSLNFGIQIR